MNEIQIKHVSASECIELCKKGALLVDVREEYDTNSKQFGIDQAVIIHASELHDNYHKLPKDRLLIIADCVGLNSKKSLIYLHGKGFDKLANLAGGILDWERQGHKVIRDKNEMFSGVCACKLKSKNSKINSK